MKNDFVDSPFFRAMNFIGDVFFLNLCWLAGCALVVTAGASTSAAFSVAGKMAAKEPYRVFHDYCTAFKRDFGLATRTWLLFAVVGVLILADYQIGLANSGAAGGALIAAAAALGVVWLCAAGCSFALLGRYTYRRWSAVVKDGLKLCVGCPHAALIWAVLMALLPVLYSLSLNLFWYVFPIWLVIGGGATITGTAWVLRPFFARLEDRT